MYLNIFIIPEKNLQVSESLYPLYQSTFDSNKGIPALWDLGNLLACMSFVHWPTSQTRLDRGE